MTLPEEYSSRLVNCETAALAYAARGWKVVPLKSGEKRPWLKGWQKKATTNPDTIQKWFIEQPSSGVGIATGRDSNLLVLDVDGTEGERTLSALFDQYGITETLMVKTGKGYHLYFTHPDMIISNKVRMLPGLDIRADGGQVVAPPTIHPDRGTPYIWDSKHNPFTDSLAQPPEWLIKLLRGENVEIAIGDRKPSEMVTGSKIPQGERNHSLFIHGCRLRAKGENAEAILQALLAMNRLQCVPPLDEAEVRRTAESCARYSPGHTYSEDEPAFHLTDTGNAERFANQHRNKARFCPSIGKWFVWDGRRYAIDHKGVRVGAMAKRTVMSLYAEAASTKDDEKEKRDALIKHARLSENKERRKALIELAQSEPGIAIDEKELDIYHDLLTVANGVIDLRTGELLNHDPARMITYFSPVSYKTNAQALNWKKFLLTIMDGDLEMVDYLQRAVGYSLTGYVDGRCMFVLIGEGQNGKSVFIDIISELLGEYAITLPVSAILAQKNDTIPNDIASLRGRRFAHMMESGENRRLAEDRVKALTGGDEITARFMRGEWFSFRPVAKFWLGTNHKPIIKGADQAIWDRIRLIPFNHRFPDEGQEGYRDRHKVIDELKAELPGILAWAVKGAQEWYKHGLRTPETVKAAVKEYRDESDLVGRFLNECCFIDKDNWRVKTSCKDFYEQFKRWCEENGELIVSKKQVEHRMYRLGYETEKGAYDRSSWVGVGIQSAMSAMSAISLDKQDPSKKPRRLYRKITDITDIADQVEKARNEIKAGLSQIAPVKKAATSEDDLEVWSE